MREIHLNVPFHNKAFHRIRLNIQYRMHESIALFPSEEFHECELSSASHLRGRPIFTPCLYWPRNSALAFIHHTGTEVYSDGSYSNHEAIDFISKVLSYIVQAGDARPPDIAVLRPYNLQKDALQKKSDISSDKV